MRITKISVKGLFGMFDHEIPLNQESRITIVHGPNGVGKTVLLRMVHALFSYDHTYLSQVPFEHFQLDYVDNTTVKVMKTFNQDDEREVSILSVLCATDSGEYLDPYTPSFSTDHVQNEARLNAYIKEELPELIEIDMLWQKTYWLLPPSHLEIPKLTGDLVDLAITMGRYSALCKVFERDEILREHPSIPNRTFGTPPDWYTKLQRETRTQTVPTSRLMHDFKRHELVMALLFRHLDSGHGYSNRSLRGITFPGPTDVVSDIERGFLIPGQYFETVDKLQENRAEIEELENVLSEEAVLRSEIATNLLEEELSFLNSWGKEQSDDSDYRRVRLFIEIMNDRLLYKSLEFDEGRKLRLRAENDSIVPFATLSSGEQQLLILYHKLLFETEPDTLVMIDEPEISMNVVWQRNFLKDLQRIIELRNFDVLIATHSPQIIHDKWDWMVPLGSKVDD